MVTSCIIDAYLHVPFIIELAGLQLSQPLAGSTAQSTTASARSELVTYLSLFACGHCLLHIAIDSCLAHNEERTLMSGTTSGSTRFSGNYCRSRTARQQHCMYNIAGVCIASTSSGISGFDHKSKACKSTCC